jgi:hypothetical protein
MTAFSLSLSHGASGMKMIDFTVGTLAPNAADVEVRCNNTDTNSHNITDHDIVILLRAIIRQIENGGVSAVNLVPRVGTTPPPPLV